MNIWMINHYATPPDRGFSTRHYFFAKELTKLGHEVSIIASGNHHLLKQPENKSLNSSVDIWQEGKVKFFLLPTPDYQGNTVGRLRNMLSFAWELLSFPQKNNLDKPDIIIGSSVHPFAVLAAEKLAHRYGIPLCFEVRDLWPQTLIDMKVISKNHPLAISLRWLEGYLYKKAKIVITLLPYAYEYISRFNIPRNKIKYLPNGVDLELFPISYSSVQEKEKLMVMYLGAHGPANGLDTLIEAAAELEKNPACVEIHWRLIGEGSEKLKLKVKVQNLGLQTIKLENSVPKWEVPKIIDEADILVFHLLEVDVFRYGISPNKLFDYLAAQKPIVFACAARNNPVEDSQAGITVAPENPQEMAEAIRQLASLSPTERAEMGRRGRAYVEKHNSYKYLGKKLNDILENL